MRASTNETVLMLPAALKIPAFRRLFLGSTLSQFGSSMTFVVLPLVLWDMTGSVAAFAGLMAANSLGVLVALPLGGVLADRFDRRVLMLWGDVVGASGMAALLVAIEWRFWAVLPVVSIITTVMGALCASAGPALRRDALPDQHRAQGTSLLQVGQHSGTLLAPIIGAAIYAAVGHELVLVIDIATFAVAFVLIARLGMANTKPERAALDIEGSAVRAAIGTARDDVRAAGSAVRRDPYLRLALAMQIAMGVGNGAFLVSVVPWLERTMHAPASTWGIIISIIGAGGLVSSLVLTRWGATIPPHLLIKIGSIGLAVGALGFVGTPPLWWMFAMTTAFGVAVATATVGAAIVEQRRIPSGLQGRFNSLEMTTVHGMQIVGVLATGFIISIWGPATAIDLFAAAFLAASAAGIAMAAVARSPAVLTEVDVDHVRSPARVSMDDELAVSG